MGLMQLKGFYYDTRTERIEANGYPIPEELKKKGYVQKNNYEGVPRWYVMPNKVWAIFDDEGTERKFNIYSYIMDSHPSRKRISLKLVQEVIMDILEGKIVATRDRQLGLVLTEAGKPAPRRK